VLVRPRDERVAEQLSDQTRIVLRPGSLHLARLVALSAGHARHAGANEGLELEEVQVLSRALDATMHGLIGLSAVRTDAPMGLAAHHEIDTALCGRKNPPTLPPMARSDPELE
jgi:hypothetical protein